jgi:hypothetical protein
MGRIDVTQTVSLLFEFWNSKFGILLLEPDLSAPNRPNKLQIAYSPPEVGFDILVVDKFPGPSSSAMLFFCHDGKKGLSRERYPQNSAGDFYVEKNACMTCLMPEVAAPELMGFDQEQGHCYFKKQPTTPEEISHAISAVASSEIQGLRYAGSDPDILRRLVDASAAECCDALDPTNRSGFLKRCLRKVLKAN